MRKIRGNISQIRELEDCIRATKRYTEGLFTKKVNHQEQGDMPSRVFTRYLEVYLDHDFPALDWERDAFEFIKDSLDWYSSRATVVKFWYDYRSNKAEISINEETVGLICNIIPNFAVALAVVVPTKEGKEYNASRNTLSRVQERSTN